MQVITGGEGLINSLKMIYNIPTNNVEAYDPFASRGPESRYDIDDDYTRYREGVNSYRYDDNSYRYNERDQSRYDNRFDAMPGNYYPSRNDGRYRGNNF